MRDLLKVVNDQRYTKERKKRCQGCEPDLVIPVIVDVGFREVEYLGEDPQNYKSKNVVKTAYGLGLPLHFSFLDQVFDDQCKDHNENH